MRDMLIAGAFYTAVNPPDELAHCVYCGARDRRVFAPIDIDDEAHFEETFCLACAPEDFRFAYLAEYAGGMAE